MAIAVLVCACSSGGPAFADEGQEIGLEEAVKLLPDLGGLYIESHYRVQWSFEFEKTRDLLPTEYRTRCLHFSSGGVLARIDHQYGSECYLKVGNGSRMWVSEDLPPSALLGSFSHRADSLDFVGLKIDPLYNLALVSGYASGGFYSTLHESLEALHHENQSEGMETVRFTNPRYDPPLSMDFDFKDGRWIGHGVVVHSPKDHAKTYPIQRWVLTQSTNSAGELPSGGVMTAHLPGPSMSDAVQERYEFEITESRILQTHGEELAAQSDMLDGLVEIPLGSTLSWGSDHVLQRNDQDSTHSTHPASQPVEGTGRTNPSVRKMFAIMGVACLLIGLLSRIRSRTWRP